MSGNGGRLYKGAADLYTGNSWRGTAWAYSESFKAEGDFVREREYAQVYEAVDELLEKCEHFGEWKVSLKEYMEILEAGFAEIQLGVIPPTLDQVVLGD
ncbi:MAG: hypothetical protein ACLSFZ_09770 [Frisingicoccus sp.]